jgi:3-methyladenine DNA glycosylase AlkD
MNNHITMTLSAKAKTIYTEITKKETRLGELRNIAKEIKKDHALAKELWSTAKFFPRLLSILIMDLKQLDANAIDILFRDMESHSYDERIQLADWLMANQLTKNKETITLIESWENDPSALKRRIYWYYQGRLRWVGQTPPDNTKELLSAIEERILKEVPEVQWAMNFTAGWIGVFDKTFRNRCIMIGEKSGLYKYDMVAKNCTPSYLPKFIEIEAGKRKL